jgi:hypothetical protein
MNALYRVHYDFCFPVRKTVVFENDPKHAQDFFFKQQDAILEKVEENEEVRVVDWKGTRIRELIRIGYKPAQIIEKTHQ